MNRFGATVRLVEDAAHTDPALATALRDWSAEPRDAGAVARLERRLTAALAAPRVACAEPSMPAWMPGVWAFSVFILLTCCLRAALPRELSTSSQSLTMAAGPSKLEMASRLGVGPRELVSQEALDSLQRVARR